MDALKKDNRKVLWYWTQENGNIKQTGIELVEFSGMKLINHSMEMKM